METKGFDPTRVRVVVGPPGTGKTTHLAACVKEAVRDRGPDAVMITSLTRTAAAEIAGRDLPLRKEAVGTLHAHAYRALGSPDLAQIPENIKAWNEANPTYQLSEGGDTFDTPEEAACGLNDNGDKLLARVSLMRANGISVESIMEMEPAVARFCRMWEEWKKAEGFIDFADMIDHARRDCEHAPNNPSLIYVDECQDLSRAELLLLRAWASHVDAIVLVGDYDQSLYEWRGADVEGIRTMGVTDDHIRVLEQSWRVPFAVHRDAVGWIDRIKGRRKNVYKPRGYDGEVRRADVSLDGVDDIIREALKYESVGKSVMILASCGYMLNQLCVALRLAGIPFHNPYRKKNGRWNPLARVERVADFLHGIGSDDSRNPWTWKQLNRWVGILATQNTIYTGVKTSLEALASSPVTKNMEATDEEVRELFRPGSFPPIEDQSDALIWLNQHVLASKSQLIQYPIEVVRKRGSQALEDKPKICVGTIHSVKGGEADVVILFPDISTIAASAWYVSRTQDAIIRQFYVGMTRARETLIIGRPSRKNAHVDMAIAAP